MITKKKWVPGHNCKFNLAKGRLTILPSPSFTIVDYCRTFDMACFHAKQKKIKKAVKVNRWWEIPTLTALA